MSDDIWRDRRDDDDFSEFGSLFDDAEPTQNVDEVTDGDPSDGERLSFGGDESGTLIRAPVRVSAWSFCA